MQNFSEEIHKAREDFISQAKEMELKYDKRFAMLKQELDLKHRYSTPYQLSLILSLRKFQSGNGRGGIPKEYAN